MVLDAFHSGVMIIVKRLFSCFIVSSLKLDDLSLFYRDKEVRSVLTAS